MMSNVPNSTIETLKEGNTQQIFVVKQNGTGKAYNTCW